MKARLKGAQTGRNLLKKKSDALSMRFRQILRKIIEVSWNTLVIDPIPHAETVCALKVDFALLSLPLQTKTKMGEVMREAAFSLAEAKFAAGDFR